MWYHNYKTQSYQINWQAVDAQGLKAAWLIDAPLSKFYDKCGNILLKSPHDYIPYSNHFSCRDSLYGISAPVCQSSIYYIDNNMSRILEVTSGNNGYNREVELLSNFTESYSMFARIYYHPSFHADRGTGIFTAFSNAKNDFPAAICVHDSVFKFTADNGLHCASGTVALPEGWYDVWGIFDSGAAINTRLIINGEEQYGTYTPAPIRPTNRDFVVAGDKGTGNNYWGTFSEIRFYNWPVPLGMAQYVYEPNNINSLYSLPEDDVFSSIVETNASLFLPSISGINNSCPLYLKAPEPINQGSLMYISGPIPWSGGTNLYIHNDRYNENYCKLFISSANINNGLSFSTGPSGRSIIFDGYSWLESDSSNSILRFDTDTTITGWFKFGSVNVANGVNQDIISFPSSPGVFRIYHARSGGSYLFGVANEIGSYSVDMRYDNIWVFFAYRYNYALQKQYFEIHSASGDYVISNFDYTVNRTPGNGKLYIGSNNGSNIVSNGTELDQFHIWHRFLSDEEIDTIRTDYF